MSKHLKPPPEVPQWFRHAAEGSVKNYQRSQLASKQVQGGLQNKEMISLFALTDDDIPCFEGIVL